MVKAGRESGTVPLEAPERAPPDYAREPKLHSELRDLEFSGPASHEEAGGSLRVHREEREVPHRERISNDAREGMGDVLPGSIKCGLYIDNPVCSTGPI